MYAEHIPSEIKKAKQRLINKEIEANMTREERDKEHDIQRKQLEAIYKLLQQQEDKFGMNNMDDMSEQMKYYMWTAVSYSISDLYDYVHLFMFVIYLIVVSVQF